MNKYENKQSKTQDADQRAADPFIFSYTRSNGFGFKKADADTNVNPILINVKVNQQNNKITTRRNNYVGSAAATTSNRTNYPQINAEIVQGPPYYQPATTELAII